MKNKQIAVLLAIIIPAVCAAWAQERPAWQESVRGGDPVTCAGLRVTETEKGAWPRLMKRNIGSDVLWPVYFCDLGKVRAGDAEKPGKPKVSGDWSYKKLVYGDVENPDMVLWASRVNPAALVQTTKGKLILFGARQKCVGFRDRTQIQFQKGTGPRYFALVSPNNATVIDGEKLGGVDPASEKVEALLCWFGEASGVMTTRQPFPCPSTFSGGGRNPDIEEADYPMLLVFDKAPAAIKSGVDGEVEVDFGEGGQLRSVAVLPISGDRFPKLAETQGWADGLPAEIRGACISWSRCLGSFPYSVTESYSYDEGQDTATITEKCEYIDLREGAEVFTPMPPMAFLDRGLWFGGQSKAGVELFGKVWASLDGCVNPELYTLGGPYMYMKRDSVELKMSGLGKAVKQRRGAGEATEKDAELVQILEEQVEKIVEAGHLAPWYCARNAYGAGYQCYWRHQDRFVWGNPGETLYYLAEALPLLNEELKARTIEYMKSERQKYPPEKIAQLKITQGARREWYRMEDTKTYIRHQSLAERNNFHISNRLIPQETLYYMAAYYEATGEKLDEQTWKELKGIMEPYLAHLDWATLGFYPWERSFSIRFEGWGGVTDANAHLAALIGYLRLAEMAGDEQAVQEGYGLLARAALWRNALGTYNRYLNEYKFYEVPKDPAFMAKYFQGTWVGQLITYDWRSYPDDVRQVTIQTPYGVQWSDSPAPNFHGVSVMPFLKAVPEVGRLAKDNFAKELKSFSDRYEMAQPAWFIAKNTTNINAEFCYTAPEESLQVFLIRAWVNGESGDKLAGYLDTPWMQRGDLYYLQKLVETIKAYRGAARN